MPKTAHFSNDHLHWSNHSKYKNHSFLVQDRFGLHLKMCHQPNLQVCFILLFWNVITCLLLLLIIIIILTAYYYYYYA